MISTKTVQILKKLPGADFIEKTPDSIKTYIEQARAYGIMSEMPDLGQLYKQKRKLMLKVVSVWIKVALVNHQEYKEKLAELDKMAA